MMQGCCGCSAAAGQPVYGRPRFIHSCSRSPLLTIEFFLKPMYNRESPALLWDSSHAHRAHGHRMSLASSQTAGCFARLLRSSGIWFQQSVEKYQSFAGGALCLRSSHSKQRRLFMLRHQPSSPSLAKLPCSYQSHADGCYRAVQLGAYFYVTL